MTVEMKNVRVCRLLRTKSAFGAVVGEDWREGNDTTAPHWCLATMESFGPDEHHVHAHDCREGRRCFQRPDDADAPDVT
jgi:hypothetical protein